MRPGGRPSARASTAAVLDAHLPYLTDGAWRAPPPTAAVGCGCGGLARRPLLQWPRRPRADAPEPLRRVRARDCAAGCYGAATWRHTRSMRKQGGKFSPGSHHKRLDCHPPHMYSSPCPEVIPPPLTAARQSGARRPLRAGSNEPPWGRLGRIGFDVGIFIGRVRRAACVHQTWRREGFVLPAPWCIGRALSLTAGQAV